MSGKKRVLVIGLDAATTDLILPWVSEGFLPNLSRLMQEGAWGNLETVPPPGTAQGWSSIITGKNPGKHGVYEILARKIGGYSLVPVNSTSRISKDIWEIMSDYGLTVGVMNVPMTYPPRRVKGFMVGGFMTPDEKCQYAYPAPLKEEIKNFFPDYRVNHKKISSITGRSRYIRHVYDTMNTKVLATIYLMQKIDWDFFMVVFNETDHFQHVFWGDMENDGEGTTHRRSRYSHVILDLYKKVDDVVGLLLNQMPPDTYVFIVSDHGAGPLQRLFHTNFFLHELGLLKLRESATVRLKRLAHKVGLQPARLYNYLDGRVPRHTLGMLGPINLLSFTVSDIDWAGTAAFSTGFGQIHINLKGRDEKGVVNPGNEYEEVVRLIIDELHKVRDPANDFSIIDKVYLREEVFRGPYLEAAPEIQFLMKRGYAPFPYGLIFGFLITGSMGVSATHEMNGILIVTGPGIKPRRIDTSILNIAPTILHVLGIPVPIDMDGKSLVEVLGGETPKPIESISSGVHMGETYRLSDEERKKIEERLKSLGYLG